MYELTETGGLCSYKKITDFCPGVNDVIFSSAMYNDTYYFITVRNNNLYSVKLGTPGSCQHLTSFPTEGPYTNSTTINSFTVDKDGIIYAADFYQLRLYKFNPYTKQTVMLGTLPVMPGGDLIFYEDKLLLSTAMDGIYEVNIADPASSKQYMPTPGYVFYGLISFPYECEKNKIYGFSPAPSGTSLVELDLDAKSVTGVVCTMPLNVYDGASIVETGNTIGIKVDSIFINAPCEAAGLKGNAQVKAYSATSGQLTYKLSNGTVNNDGKFGPLDLGNYQVKIINDIGCIKDTFFTIARGLSPDIRITATDPVSCDLQNGSILIQSFSAYQPVMISINNGPPQTNHSLTDLGAGLYNISLSDQGNCKRDTSVALKYKKRPEFLGPITSLPTVCEAFTGTIKVAVNGNGFGISASLDGGSPQSGLQFNNLDAGNHLLSVFSTGNCRYDTVVKIEKLYDPRPQITMQSTPQVCFENNGIVTIGANGVGSPFSYSFNNAGYVSSTRFDKLAPGSYPIRIRNRNLCEWDTTAHIPAYAKLPVDFTVSKVDPNCKEIVSGEVRVNISGAEMPYSFRVDNNLYSSGDVAFARPGEYTIEILNRDQCMLDTAHVSLNLVIEPDCDRVSVPNAFSPNNDGNNDRFRAIHGPYIRNVVLTVYNRYGQVIHRSSDSQSPSGWDGMYAGKSLDQGAYPWTLTYVDFRGEKKKLNGLVMLVR